ncbi:hypothetical protein CLU79DRAFT_837803 [Phycomyces nitens]|nr:hypothetical protein CLU79DRAFT_837803 [Phycomyces nitens]
MPTETKNSKVVWGFMLENTYFMEFDHSNHAIIELAYRQRRLRQASHYITIRDSNLPSPARVYFGVAQVHLRMPGTRYYVKRRVVKQPQSASSLAIATNITTTTTTNTTTIANTASSSSSSTSSSSSCLPSPSPDPIVPTSNYDPFPTQFDPAFEAMLWSGDIGWSLQPQALQQAVQSYPQLYSQPLALAPPPTSVAISAPIIQNQYLSTNIETSVEKLLWDQWFAPPSAQDGYRTPFSTAQLTSYGSLLPY